MYFLIPAVITQMFNPIAELVIPRGVPVKEAKSEMETHPVPLEINISKCSVFSKPYKLSYTSCSLIHFDLFLQLNNFLFLLYFSV